MVWSMLRTPLIPTTDEEETFAKQHYCEVRIMAMQSDGAPSSETSIKIFGDGKLTVNVDIYIEKVQPGQD